MIIDVVLHGLQRDLFAAKLQMQQQAWAVHGCQDHAAAAGYQCTPYHSNSSWAHSRWAAGFKR
jgi:hypothetical protein